MLTEQDVAGLLQVSVRTLQEWRRLKLMPPELKVLHGKIVSYPARRLLEWIDSPAAVGAPQTSPTHTPAMPAVVPLKDVDGFDEPLLKGGRKRKSIHRSFAEFMSSGMPADQWLFVLRSAYERPIDWNESLLAERTLEDPVIWLSLGDYLDTFRKGI